MARSPLKQPKTEPKSPLKSSLRQTPTPKSTKKCTFENESFMMPAEVYNTPTKLNTKKERLEIIEASEFIPTELVLYISALQVFNTRFYSKFKVSF